MAELSSEGKFLVACSRCGQVDDHPMHHIGAAAGGERHSFHTDCHALAGCAICVESRARAGVSGEKGAALAQLLVDAGPVPADRIAELTGQGR